MEADLERLKKDRGQGEPVKLVESVGGARGVAMTGQPIEIKLGGGEESGDDSDDLPAERGGEEDKEGEGIQWNFRITDTLGAGLLSFI